MSRMVSNKQTLCREHLYINAITLINPNYTTKLIIMKDFYAKN